MPELADSHSAFDLFDQENRALQMARAAFDRPDAPHRDALSDLIGAYERLLRETRRLVRRSDREELEMNRLNQRLHDLASELEFRATHDSLTGVLNRGAIIDRANRRLQESDLALVVLDIDHFKRVNDNFGHPVGDAVIRGVVACLKQVVPATADIGRVGGEEFTVLMNVPSFDSATDMAERMRLAVAGQGFEDLPRPHHITASFGVSWLRRGGSFDNAYSRADEALYQAKRLGRNQVVRSDSLALT
jgi:diguanylate cyclase (GGDEF)-like protein